MIAKKKLSQNVISVTSNWKLQGEALKAYNSIPIEGVEKTDGWQVICWLLVCCPSKICFKDEHFKDEQLQSS